MLVSSVCLYTCCYFCNAHGRIGEILGSGQFGTVHKGTWEQPSKAVTIAAKMLKTDASAMDRIKFLQEAATMAQFKHPNVVTLYGVAKKGGNVSVLLYVLYSCEVLYFHAHICRE